MKQVDTTDLKSVAERRTGSTPVFPTNCPGGVMVATLVLEASAEMRASSSLA